MKQTLLGFALVLLGLQFSAQACPAQSAALPKTLAKTVSAIKDEAGEAQQNAAIYQWQRVNREVDRLVADARKLTAARPASFSFDALQKDVQALRSARLHRDVDSIAEATRRIIADSNALLKL